jgi:hypothetical protein
MSFPGLVYSSDYLVDLQKKERNYSKDILDQKTVLANMIASHDSDNGVRAELFDLLSQYRRVEAPGNLRYNMPNGERVNRQDGSKRALQQRCKFTLCCESTCEQGFITEKMFEAFLADTIPVYLGSNTVGEYFNRDAFINVAEYEDLQGVVERIIELDQNDEAYLEMLRQPVFVEADFIQGKLNELEEFLCNIFDQPIDQAFRRPTSFHPKVYEKIVSLGSRVYAKEQYDYWVQEERKRKNNEKKEFWRYLPNRILFAIVGKNRYQTIKSKIGRD